MNISKFTMIVKICLIYFGIITLYQNSMTDRGWCQEKIKQQRMSHSANVKYCGGVISIGILRTIPKVTLLQEHPFHINVIFAQSVTTAQRAVIQFAVNEWDNLLDSSLYVPNNYQINVNFAPIVSGAILANTQTYFYIDDGELDHAEMTFDNDGSIQWYVDPNPATDNEFGSGNPPAGFDLLSVARHEIGHAIGWTGSKRVSNLLTGGVFDQPGLNIATAGDTGHTDPNIYVNELMNPAIGPSERHSIALYPDVSLPSKAYYYWVPGIRCLDASYAGSQNGSLYHPWNNAMVGFLGTPEGGLMIALQGSYPLILPTVRATNMTIISPRDKDAFIFGVFK